MAVCVGEKRENSEEEKRGERERERPHLGIVRGSRDEKTCSTSCQNSIHFIQI